MLRAARVPPFTKRLRRITHGAIRLAQGRRHITGQFAHLLHQFTKCSAQGALRARIPCGFFTRFGRLRAGRRWPARIIARIFLISTAAMRAVQHFRFPPHHVLKRAHLLLAALALLALTILGPAGAAFFQGLQHFLKLGHFAFGIFLPAIARGVFQAASAAFQFPAIKHALLRVIGQRFIIFALHAFGQGFQVAANGFAQFLNAALQLGALFGAFFWAAFRIGFGVLATRFFQSLTQRFTRLGQSAGAAVRAAFFQGDRHIPQNLLHFRHGFITPVAHQPMPGRTQRQVHARIMFESFRRIADAVQFAPRRFSCAGVKRQRAPQRDQLLRDGMRKAPFRQYQKRAFGFAFLFRTIARKKPRFHFQPSPRMGGKIMLRRPLRLARRTAGQGHVLYHWRGGGPLL